LEIEDALIDATCAVMGPSLNKVLGGDAVEILQLSKRSPDRREELLAICLAWDGEK